MKIFDFDKFNLEQKKYGGSDKKYSIKVEDTYFMIKEPYLELKKIQDGGNKENIEQDEDIMDLE